MKLCISFWVFLGSQIKLGESNQAGEADKSLENVQKHLECITMSFKFYWLLPVILENAFLTEDNS